VEVRRGTRPVLLARLARPSRGQPVAAGPAVTGAEVGAPFTDRLVEKFGLPVTGWRGRGAAARHADAGREGRAGPKIPGRDEDEEPGGDA
jgi:NAD+ kinase